jgi:hypothetical protein
MIEYLKFFFSLNHLLTLRPQAMQLRAIMILAITFGLLIVFGLANRLTMTKIKDNLKIKGLKKFFKLGLTMGILGYLYLFFAWQGIVLLAARFWLVVWLIITLVWFGFIVRYLLIAVPKMRQEIEQKRKFEKYIP